MNFSSIPAYLDPSNWQQQGGGSISNHHQLTSPPSQTAPPPPLPPPPPPVVPLQPHGGGGGVGGGAGSIRPGSMADRARMTNMPMPEMALKCPRCDSTNTKFCYFNNYSLSQPRHFCKACKRYWTRGGALRNVPVGGGCRRNKRSSNSKSNSNNNNNNNNSKSPASSTSTDGRQATNNSGSTSTISSHSNSLMSGPTSAASLLGLMNPQIPPLRFMSPLGQFSTSDHHHNHHHHHFTPSSNHMNLNFSTSSTCGNVLGGTGTTECVMVNNTNNFLGIGAGAGAGVASILSSGNLEHWRMQQQFPNFLAGFDPSNSPSSGVNNYPFHQGGVHESVQFLGGDSTSQINRPKISTSMLNQMASVKMEDNNNNNNNNNNQDHQSALSRQLLGIQGNNDQNWNTASAWSDLSASFSSSSTSNAL